MLIIWILQAVIIIWMFCLTVYLFLNRNKTKASSQSTSFPQLHLSLVRYDPFSDTGGEQSFVLSLLDGGGNGILLTSLHGRGMTRIYAKRINGGKADQELSAEEKKAIAQALNK